jgi:hypothetical protein
MVYQPKGEEISDDKIKDFLIKFITYFSRNRTLVDINVVEKDKNDGPGVYKILVRRLDGDDTAVPETLTNLETTFKQNHIHVYPIEGDIIKVNLPAEPKTIETLGKMRTASFHAKIEEAKKLSINGGVNHGRG